MNIRSGLAAILTAVFVLAGLAAPAEAGVTYTTNLRAAARALPLAAENNLGFDRARYFGSGWIDTNRDCQYTRAEVLISETRVAPTYSSSRCTVTAGRWVTNWDNKVHTSPTTVQIDHLIPVAEAWGSGARNWTQARRITFYNDLYPHSLNAQTNLLNQQKQAKGP
ncbi:HNH endonuclease family protein [Arthrobacter crusticola]|uniref:HNH endonuclease family protein n=1 Tax=Arthrobacter crusticola TaxID=2547960 RepID=UPI001FE4B595|nr:HNH endonuclease family protein [Arthrobacter crusticola]